jgi:hypothetical protein
MVHWVYLVLLRLHPRAFRERFGDEMIAIFEEEERSGNNVSLLFDAVSSLFRQRFLRPPRREPSFSMAGPVRQPSDVPLFHTFDSSLPRRSALVNGAVLSLICLVLLNFANSHGSVNFPRLLIGAKYPRPHPVPVDRASVKEAEPTTEIKVKAPAVDPLYELADIYFKIIRVLDTLDTDRDRVVSAQEIAAASSALTKLDGDGDGSLSGEECGFFLGNSSKSKLDEQFAERTRLEFMRLNPVLATLDSDRNGFISAGEIRVSATALTTLDRNGDGALTPHEVLPIPIDNRTATQSIHSPQQNARPR